MTKITRRARGRRTGRGAAGHARHHPRAEHVEAGAHRPAQRHGRPVSRRRRSRQPRSPSELAVADFGGSVLDRPIEVLQGDDQNKPDVSQFAGARMDRQPGRRCARRRRRVVGRSRDPAGLPREEAHLSDHRTGHVGHDRQAVLAVRHPLRLRHLCAGTRHRRVADQGRRRHLVLHHRRLCVRLRAGARHHRRGAGSRRQGARHGTRTAGDGGFLELPGAGEGVGRQGVRLRQRRHRPAELHQAGGRVRPVAGRHAHGDAADGDQRRALARARRPARVWSTRTRSTGT